MSKRGISRARFYGRENVNRSDDNSLMSTSEDDLLDISDTVIPATDSSSSNNEEDEASGPFPDSRMSDSETGVDVNDQGNASPSLPTLRTLPTNDSDALVPVPELLTDSLSEGKSPTSPNYSTSNFIASKGDIASASLPFPEDFMSEPVTGLVTEQEHASPSQSTLPTDASVSELSTESLSKGKTPNSPNISNLIASKGDVASAPDARMSEPVTGVTLSPPTFRSLPTNDTDASVSELSTESLSKGKTPNSPNISNLIASKGDVASAPDARMSEPVTGVTLSPPTFRSLPTNDTDSSVPVPELSTESLSKRKSPNSPNCSISHFIARKDDIASASLPFPEDFMSEPVTGLVTEPKSVIHDNTVKKQGKKLGEGEESKKKKKIARAIDDNTVKKQGKKLGEGEESKKKKKRVRAIETCAQKKSKKENLQEKSNQENSKQKSKEKNSKEKSKEESKENPKEKPKEKCEKKTLGTKRNSTDMCCKSSRNESYDSEDELPIKQFIQATTVSTNENTCENSNATLGQVAPLVIREEVSKKGRGDVIANSANIKQASQRRTLGPSRALMNVSEPGDITDLQIESVTISNSNKLHSDDSSVLSSIENAPVVSTSEQTKATNRKLLFQTPFSNTIKRNTSEWKCSKENNPSSSINGFKGLFKSTNVQKRGFLRSEVSDSDSGDSDSRRSILIGSTPERSRNISGLLSSTPFASPSGEGTQLNTTETVNQSHASKLVAKPTQIAAVQETIQTTALSPISSNETNLDAVSDRDELDLDDSSFPNLSSERNTNDSGQASFSTPSQKVTSSSQRKSKARTAKKTSNYCEIEDSDNFDFSASDDDDLLYSPEPSNKRKEHKRHQAGASKQKAKEHEDDTDLLISSSDEDDDCENDKDDEDVDDEDGLDDDDDEVEEEQQAKNPHKKKKKTDVPEVTYQWSSEDLAEVLLDEPATDFDEPDSKHPLEYFLYYFDDDILQFIVEQTNLYSAQRNPDKEPMNLTVHELKVFLGIWIFMGICSLPCYHDYWYGVTRVPLIANAMPHSRFKLIRARLHFSDNEAGEDGEDGVRKVRPLLNHINQKCKELEQHTNKFSIDEAVVRYKGKKAGHLRQYLKNKPHKWGYKVYVLTSSSGIAYDFLVYSGSKTFETEGVEEKEELGKGGSVVYHLCHSIQKPQTSAVCFDNYFTSLPLIALLKSELGLISIGTLRADRTKKCPLSADKVLKKAGRGTSEVKKNEENTAVVKWSDNKCVLLASSWAGIAPEKNVQRWDKKTRKYIEVKCPRIVQLYNSNMGGVDLLDMLISLYRLPTRAKRWPIPLVAFMIDLSLVNSYLSYKRDQQNIDSDDSSIAIGSKDFRLKVVAGLLAEETKKRGRPTLQNIKVASKVIRTPVIPRPCEELRRDNGGHLPIHTKKGRCRNCKGGYSSWKCESCNVILCIVPSRNCFSQFHVV